MKPTQTGISTDSLPSEPDHHATSHPDQDASHQHYAPASAQQGIERAMSTQRKELSENLDPRSYAARAGVAPSLTIDTQPKRAASNPVPSTTHTRPTRTASVSDRSPLQKLESALGDLSKEEKRARLEDAEHRAIQRSATAHARSAPASKTKRSSRIRPDSSFFDDSDDLSSPAGASPSSALPMPRDGHRPMHESMDPSSPYSSPQTTPRGPPKQSAFDAVASWDRSFGRGATLMDAASHPISVPGPEPLQAGGEAGHSTMSPPWLPADQTILPQPSQEVIARKPSIGRRFSLTDRFRRKSNLLVDGHTRDIQAAHQADQEVGLGPKDGHALNSKEEGRSPSFLRRSFSLGRSRIRGDSQTRSSDDGNASARNFIRKLSKRHGPPSSWSKRNPRDAGISGPELSSDSLDFTQDDRFPRTNASESGLQRSTSTDTATQAISEGRMGGKDTRLPPAQGSDLVQPGSDPMTTPVQKPAMAPMTRQSGAGTYRLPDNVGDDELLSSTADELDERYHSADEVPDSEGTAEAQGYTTDEYDDSEMDDLDEFRRYQSGHPSATPGEQTPIASPLEHGQHGEQMRSSQRGQLQRSRSHRGPKAPSNVEQLPASVRKRYSQFEQEGDDVDTDYSLSSHGATLGHGDEGPVQRAQTTRVMRPSRQGGPMTSKPARSRSLVQRVRGMLSPPDRDETRRQAASQSLSRPPVLTHHFGGDYAPRHSNGLDASNGPLTSHSLDASQSPVVSDVDEAAPRQPSSSHRRSMGNYHDPPVSEPPAYAGPGRYWRDDQGGLPLPRPVTLAMSEKAARQLGYPEQNHQGSWMGRTQRVSSAQDAERRGGAAPTYGEGLAKRGWKRWT